MPISPALAAGMLPELAKLCAEHIRRCEQRGVQVAVVSARRSVADQMALFRKGRELRDGLWIKTGAPIVTNALPEKAPHCPHVDEHGNVGCAAYDLAIVINEKCVFEDVIEGKHFPRPEYMNVVGPVGEGLGLVWGHRFHSLDDIDHFELNSWRAMPVGTDAQSPNRRAGLAG